LVLAADGVSVVDGTLARSPACRKRRAFSISFVMRALLDNVAAFEHDQTIVALRMYSNGAQSRR
jgi:hypothetical protein